MSAIVMKSAPQLRKGDIVRFYGGRFEVIADPRESNSHRPEGYWPAAGVGPSDCTVAPGICLQGSVPGYFKPGSDWAFQGNHLSRFSVEVSA